MTCDKSETRVWVVEVLRVFRGFVPEDEEDESPTDSILIPPSLFKLFGGRRKFFEQYYEAPEVAWSEQSTYYEYVVRCPGHLLQDRYSGEFIRIRPVEGQEIFNALNDLLLLEPAGITKLHTDLAQHVFGERKGELEGDARLLLFDAAFDLLYGQLKEDYNRCGTGAGTDCLAEVITDVLRPIDLYGVSRSDVFELADEVIRLVSERVDPAG